MTQPAARMAHGGREDGVVDIEFLKTLVVEAGKSALQRVSGIVPEFKGDGSYVTEIDRETERFLRSRLAERYPDYAFQGEEFGRFGPEDAPLWAVDPIDGTTNMVFGIPLWLVSVGLIADGQAQAGALYLPCTDELFWAGRGKGAFCNGVRLHALERDSIHSEDTLGFTSSSIKRVDVSGLRGRIRCLGSIAAEVVYTARGTLCSHIGCFEGLNDLAAALCVAYEAGCVAEYLSGEPLDVRTLVREGCTSGPFLIAAPRTVAVIRPLVRVRA